MNIASLSTSSAGRFFSNFSQTLSSSLSNWSGVILGTSAVALTSLCLYRVTQGNKNGEERKEDINFDRAKARVTQVYSYVFGGLAATALAATAAHVSGISLSLLQNGFIGLAVFGVSMVALWKTIATSKEDMQTKKIALAVFNVSMGVLLSPLGFVSKAILAQAAFITLGIGSVLTLTAYLAPDRAFLEWEGPLMTAFTTLCVASLVALLFPQTAFAYGVDRVSLYGGLALFSAFFCVSTQKITAEAQDQDDATFDPIRSSLDLYLDTLNIFVRIVRILQENQGTKKA